MNTITRFLIAIVLMFSIAELSVADGGRVVRIGTLQFGTVNWELDTAKHYGLDAEQGIRIEISQYANKQAVHIVFQGEEVDMMVSDWVWVSRRRADGESFSFIPYSSSLGAVMIPPQSDIKKISDLSDLRVGVAGGSHDKSWLLLQAWSHKKHDFILADNVDVSYAAPPLLNGQIVRDNLDAVLNFWHYCARLEAQGYRGLIKMSDVVNDLGVRPIPMVGYIFREDWAKQHDGIIAKFSTVLYKAREILRNDATAWERLRPLMRVDDEATFMALRDRYREGIPQPLGKSERESAMQLMKILFAIGGSQAVGKSNELMPGTFWQEGY